MHKVLKILITASILCNIGFALLEPIYAIFVQEIGGHILEAAISVSLFSIVYGISVLIFGKLSDLKKDMKNKLIVLGYSIVTLSFLGYYFVRNPIDLFIVQAAIGFGTALIDPAWDALFSIYITKGKEATEWGIQKGLKEIVIGVFALVGGVIAAVLGFKVLILTMFCFELLATISIARLLWVKK